MQPFAAEIALLTERRYVATMAPEGDTYFGNILHDDGLLLAALQAQGVRAVRVDWADPAVDWAQFKGLVFRTTWDYFDRFPEFAAWLQQVKGQTQLCNPATIVEWNMDKHYLADLAAQGLPVVPSQFVERGSQVTVPELLAAAGWAEAILKPCVSGSARHTYRVNRDNAATLTPIAQQLLATESLIFQPFITSVVAHGEETLMVLDGQFSHAVRKVPQAGDFRVQDDYGGTVHECVPSAEQIALAERAVRLCQPLPAYGRVDMVQDAAGQWVLMELELIEPELWLRKHPPAATALAEAIIARMLRVD